MRWTSFLAAVLVLVLVIAGLGWAVRSTVATHSPSTKNAPSTGQISGDDPALADEEHPEIPRTAKDEGLIIPAVVTIYTDRSYSFITKTPPASVLLKRAANLAKGSAEPNKYKVGTVTQKQVEEIAKKKLADLNARDLEHAGRIIEGTARSMGIAIQG